MKLLFLSIAFPQYLQYFNLFITVTSDGIYHSKCPDCIDRYIKANYDLTPKGIIKALHLLDVDYNLVSSGGHFGKDMLPWEMDDEMIDEVYGNHEFDPLDFSDNETPKNRKRDVF